MTVSSSADRATFPGNGVTTVFPLPFRFFANSEINVWLIEDATSILTPQVLGTHYSLVGAAEPELDGNPASVLTMFTAPAADFSLFVQRIIPVTQPTDIVNQGRFFPETHENVFDRLTLLIQQNAGQLARAIRVPDSDPVPNLLPPVAERVGKLQSYDEDGNPVTVAAAAQSATDLELRLADSSDPAKGAGMVGWNRSAISAAITTAHQMLDVQTVNAWEYASLIVSKPTPSDPNTWDWTPALQAMLDFLVLSPIRPLKGRLPPLTLNVSADLVVNVRATGLSVNYGRLELEGIGGAAIGGADFGTTLKCSTAGVNILRMCEEQPSTVNVSGAYPGGGAGVVTLPLNFLRRVKLSNITFAGLSASPTAINGFVGRGIFSSEFVNCGFQNLNYGIRLGKAEATAQEQSAESIDLDYCERNSILNCMFERTQTHIHILAGDITTIEGCTHNPCPTAAGRFYYFAGGNDFYRVVGNILQPRDVSGNALTKAIHTVGGRGYLFHGNHIEGMRGRLLEQLSQTCEVVTFTENLLYADVALTTHPFGLFLRNQGKFYMKRNTIVAPSVTPRYINVSTPGNLFETLHLDYDDNGATTTLGGSTQLSIISNLEGANLNYGRFGDPLYLGKALYLWTTSAGVLRAKTTKPTSQTDGFVVGEQVETKGTFAFPGISVSANSGNSVSVTVSGAAVGKFSHFAPDTSLGDLVWSANTTSGSTVRFTFYNWTGGGITIPAGTWTYKVENT